MTIDESLIPKGPYCYTPDSSSEAKEAWEKFGIFKVHPCPYWERYDSKKHGPLPQEIQDEIQNALLYPGAFCKFLNTGDWMPDGTMLLWDQVKECGVNCDREDEDS